MASSIIYISPSNEAFGIQGHILLTILFHLNINPLYLNYLILMGVLQLQTVLKLINLQGINILKLIN